VNILALGNHYLQHTYSLWILNECSLFLNLITGLLNSIRHRRKISARAFQVRLGSKGTVGLFQQCRNQSKHGSYLVRSSSCCFFPGHFWVAFLDLSSTCQTLQCSRGKKTPSASNQLSSCCRCFLR